MVNNENNLFELLADLEILEKLIKNKLKEDSNK